MWQLLRVSLAGLAIGVTSLFLSENVTAAGDSWMTSSVVKLSEVQGAPLADDVKSCAGRTSLVQIKSESGTKSGCITGNSAGTRLVRYRQANAQFAYAVAFATDGVYMKVNNLCTNMTYCLYSQVDDTLLLQIPQGNGHAVGYIKGFARYLKRVSDQYIFEYSGTLSLITANHTPVLAEALGISTNGKWAIVSVRDIGFVIIDVKQQKYKRIAFFDSATSTTERSFELTISDDGRWGIAVGYLEDPYVFEITDRCGDFLEIGHGQGNVHETLLCDGRLLGLRTMVSGFVSGHAPRFASNGKRLTFEVASTQKFMKVTLVPEVTGSGNPFYVAFGDSFSSGEGETSDTFYVQGTNTATNRCHVSSRSYPYLLQSSWDIVALNLACSGSRIPEVQQASQTFLRGSHPENPSVISLGIGGNDVDFMGKLKSCIGIGTCEWATSEKRLSTAHEIKNLFPKLVDSITELKNNFSPARLFLVGYPDVINSSSSAGCSLTVGALFTHDERRYMSESIKYLNNVLRAAAHYTNTAFADIESAYEGERLCDEKQLAMNAVRFGDDIAPIPLVEDLRLIGAESFHPTPRGHQLAAVRIASELESFWNSTQCENCVYTESQLDIPPYWKEVTPSNTPFIQQIAHQFLSLEPILSIPNVAFNFIPDIFAPHSIIRFELHSDVKQLGVFSAGDDGSLQGTLAIPGGVKGYHTVHAYGESRSGELIDMYQTVYVDTPEVTDSNHPQNLSALSSDRVPPSTSAVLAQQTQQGFAQRPQSKGSSKSLASSSRINDMVAWVIILLVSIGLMALILPPLISKMRQKL